MAVILWSILNLLVLVAVLYLFWRAAMLLRQHVGLGTSLCFSLVSLAMCGGAARQSAAVKNLLPPPLTRSWVGSGTIQQTKPLGLVNQLEIVGEYDTRHGAFEARSLHAGVSGMVFGHDWYGGSGTLEPAGAGLRYSATLHHDWYLLNVKVYSSRAELISGMAVPAVAAALP